MSFCVINYIFMKKISFQTINIKIMLLGCDHGRIVWLSQEKGDDWGCEKLLPCNWPQITIPIGLTSVMQVFFKLQEAWHSTKKRHSLTSVLETSCLLDKFSTSHSPIRTETRSYSYKQEGVFLGILIRF